MAVANADLDRIAKEIIQSSPHMVVIFAMTQDLSLQPCNFYVTWYVFDNSTVFSQTQPTEGYEVTEFPTPAGVPPYSKYVSGTYGIDYIISCDIIAKSVSESLFKCENVMQQAAPPYESEQRHESFIHFIKVFRYHYPPGSEEGISRRTTADDSEV